MAPKAAKARGLYPGRRVLVPESHFPPEDKQGEPFGTVLELLDDSRCLVLLDQRAVAPRPETRNLWEHHDPRIRDLAKMVDVVEASDLAIVSFDHPNADYMRYAPEFLGVCVRAACRIDSVKFPAGAAGKLVSLSPGGASVSWVNFTSQHFSEHCGVYGRRYRNGYYISPTSLLMMCFLSGNEVIATFGVLGEPEAEALSPGDMIFYNHPLETRHEHGSLLFGDILVVEQSGSGAVIARPVNFDPRDEGSRSSARLPRSKVDKFLHPWLPRGTKVTVSSETLFRKRDLQGQQAVVVTPTDLEGDVGVQFAEDIGGGSLDGAGEDGKCLYLPANRLKAQT